MNPYCLLLNIVLCVYFLCAACVFADISEGGPSKPELLALLQNCDISPASRVSSTFSSRAPSPSPSLMSIMYPSVRLPGGRVSKPVSPLSTPVLNVGRSRMPTDGAVSGDNLFQPICMSHSNSSISFGEGAVSKASETVFVTPSSPGRLDKDEVPDSQASTTGVEAVLQEQKETETDEENCKDRSSEDTNRCKFDGNSHQRSRSNEMDYVSLQSDSRRRPRLHSFRSPSGSMQTFKASCGDVVSPPAAHSMGSPVRGDSPAKSDDATISAKDRESRSEPRETAGREGENPDTVLGDQFSLLKEFDSSLWSNYFTSLDNPRYSDC